MLDQKSPSTRTQFLDERDSQPVSRDSHSEPEYYVIERPVSRKVTDLSSEVEFLGDYPAARGVVSSIWLGKISNDRRVAVKLFVPNRPTGHQDFLREAHVWSRAAHHENVMPLLGVARLRNTVALISPWMQEGDLLKYLSTHVDVNVVQLMADVACGLAYIHSQGIVYGNLRSSTILVSEMGRAYLSSFLVAHAEDGDRYAGTQILDWRISSPEFISLSSFPLPLHRIAQTSESDVFAFGTTVMEAATFGQSHSRYRDAMKNSFLRGNIPQRPQLGEDWGLTDDLWLLVNRCWERDPQQRPTMAEVARRMVEIAEGNKTLSTRPAVMPRTLKNISAEIKKLSEHPIAGGGYCDLYLGERLGNEKVALKLVRLLGSTDADKDAARRRFLSEARMWAELDHHPRILKFHGICEYGTMSLFMVSPFCSYGNIMQYLSNVASDADRRRLLIETAEGLLYLHSCKLPVIHGDLKGANILISDTGNALLADFGLSRISHEETTTMLHGAGSPRWMAPELITASDEETGPLKTPKTDVYAFGHTMLEVLGNCKPFFHLREDLHVIVELIHNKRSPRPSGPIADRWLDDSTWAYCQTCTSIDPDKRPDMEAVVTDLRLKFLGVTV